MNQEWFNEVLKSALGWPTSVEETYDVCRASLEHGIPGDFVECGVYQGAQAAVMARAIMDAFPASEPFRQVHLFDNFNGIPGAGPEDVEFIEAKHPKGLASCSLEQVKANMERWGIPDSMLVYHVGYFHQTIWKNCLGRIAVLRLDGDLYRSTKVCMDYLYQLVSPGGYVIVDDFNLSGCRQAILEHFAPSAPAPIYFRKPPQ